MWALMAELMRYLMALVAKDNAVAAGSPRPPSALIITDAAERRPALNTPK